MLLLTRQKPGFLPEQSALMLSIGESAKILCELPYHMFYNLPNHMFYILPNAHKNYPIYGLACCPGG